jgi:site-specific recombinase XerD
VLIGYVRSQREEISVTKLIQRMREELVRRNYAERTIRSYLQTLEEFRRFADKRLDHLGADDIRKYHVHLLEEKKLAVGTVAYRVAALRFFYGGHSGAPR